MAAFVRNKLMMMMILLSYITNTVRYFVDTVSEHKLLWLVHKYAESGRIKSNRMLKVTEQASTLCYGRIISYKTKFVNFFGNNDPGRWLHHTPN